MTIHESAQQVVTAWTTQDEDTRYALGSNEKTVDLVVRIGQLMAAVDSYGDHPGRRAEYPNPRDGEHEISGPIQHIQMAQIVVRSDGGPWAVHNQPCAVCGERLAILDLNEGVMHPCWSCQRLGWDLKRSKPRWWQKRYRSRAGVAE